MDKEEYGKINRMGGYLKSGHVSKAFMAPSWESIPEMDKLAAEIDKLEILLDYYRGKPPAPPKPLTCYSRSLVYRISYLNRKWMDLRVESNPEWAAYWGHVLWADDPGN